MNKKYFKFGIFLTRKFELKTFQIKNFLIIISNWEFYNWDGLPKNNKSVSSFFILLKKIKI